MLNFGYTDNTGDNSVVSSNDVFQHLKDAGLNPTSLSPDGTTIYSTGPKGQAMQAKVSDLVNQNYGKLGSVIPDEQFVDRSNVDGSLARQIAEFPTSDDNAKIHFLNSTLASRSEKLHGAKIVGSGDDFYVFNPQTQKYMALTRGEGLGMDDVQRAIPTAVKAVGAIGGGILGGLGGAAAAGATTLGIGAPAGALAGSMAGSGAGGQLARVAMEKLEGWANPEFKVAEENLTPEQQSEATKNHLWEAGIDTALPGVFHGLGAVGGKAMRAILNNGAASTALRGAGAAANITGDAVAGTAKFVDEGGLRVLAGQGVPGVGEATMAGDVLQAPKWGVTKIPEYLGKGARWAEKKLSGKAFQLAEEDAGNPVKSIFDHAADAGTPEYRPAVDGSGSMFEEIPHDPEVLRAAAQRNAGIVARGNQAASYMDHAGKFGKAADFFEGLTKPASEEAPLVDRAASALRQGVTGVSEEAPAPKATAESVMRKIGQKLGSRADDEYLARGPVQGSTKFGSYGDAWAGAGRGMDKTAAVGKMVSDTADGAFSLGLKATGGLAKGVSIGGKILNATGTLAQPLENRFLARHAAQSYVPQAAHKGLVSIEDLIKNRNQSPDDFARSFGYSH